MVAGIVGTSLLAFVIVIIGTWAGVGADGGFGEGAWPFIVMIPNVGLPIGFVLIIALLIVSAARRGRAAKGAGK